MGISQNWRDYTDAKTRWRIFFNQAFIDFRGDTRKTVQDFAETLGISQPMASQYMSRNGNTPRSQKQIALLQAYFGDIIYEVLGFSKPDDPLKYLPDRLGAAAREIRDTLAEYNASPSSPEGIRLSDEIMKKHGYTRIEANSPEEDL